MKIKPSGWLLTTVLLLAAVVGIQYATAQGGGAVGCKVAFVDLAKVLDTSKQGQQLKKAIEAEKTKRFAPLKSRQTELEKLEQQITTLTQEILQKSQVWDRFVLANKQNELQSLQMKYNNQAQSLQIEKAKVMEDLSKKKDEMLKPLEDKLNKIMEDIGKKGGYCMIMDVSPPAPNFPNFNPILYRDPALEITNQVIAAVDK